MTRLTAIIAALVIFAGAANGTELNLPAGSRQISERNSGLDGYALPVGAYNGSEIPVVRLEGRIERQTWQIVTPGLSIMQVLAPLRDQLDALGFTVVFDCEARECGGFDFRFMTEVVPAPDMYVDIRNFRFLSARRGENEAVSLLVSRRKSAAFIQVIYVNRDSNGPVITPKAETVAPDSAASDAPDLMARLVEQGHVVLPDLVFATGAAALDPGRYPSLDQLAAYLAAHPGLVVAVVGHTDSIGKLERNIALSKRRAQSVRTRLIENYGISAARIQAEGMGYLAPIASNLTAEGREANRRVEVILLSDR